MGQFENHRGYNGAMIGLPGYTYHLEFTERLLPGALPPPHPDNLLVFYFDLPAEYSRPIHQLTIIGAKQVQPSNPYWAEKAQTFEDPDGNRIVLCKGVFKK
ncbi:hypothetical protein [Chitinophaga caeni]|uniref:hypothetical protein n=1 Tax=Chitinophaga caeni TaxID=2029983 RepID=UPI00374436EA